jgi:hypothetical protein
MRNRDCNCAKNLTINVEDKDGKIVSEGMNRVVASLWQA